MKTVSHEDDREIRFVNEDLARICARDQKKGNLKFIITFWFSVILAGLCSLLPIYTIIGQSKLSDDIALWASISVFAAGTISTVLEFIAVKFDTKASDKDARENYKKYSALGKYYEADVVVKGPSFRSLTANYLGNIKLACVFFRVAWFVGSGIGILALGGRGTLIAWIMWAAMTWLLVAIEISSYSEDFMKSLPADDIPDYQELGIELDSLVPSKNDELYALKLQKEKRRKAEVVTPGLKEVLFAKKGGE